MHTLSESNLTKVLTIRPTCNPKQRLSHNDGKELRSGGKFPQQSIQLRKARIVSQWTDKQRAERRSAAIGKIAWLQRLIQCSQTA
jgi:hypothetical protein